MENKELTTTERKYPVVVDTGEFSGYMDSSKFEHGQRVAAMFASSKLVPVHYQNEQSNCMIAINLAIRLNLDPMLLMQKTYIIHGKMGIETQLAIALVNKSSIFEDRIQFKYSGEGDTRACKAFAFTRKSKGVNECSDTCSVPEAKKMGWWSKNGSFWPKMTDTMLAYRAAIKMIRLYCPEVLMGLDTSEELRDTGIINVTPEHNGTETEIISEKISGKMADQPFFGEEKKKQTHSRLNNEQIMGKSEHKQVAKLRRYYDDKEEFDDIFSKLEEDEEYSSARIESILQKNDERGATLVIAAVKKAVKNAVNKSLLP